MPDVIDAAPSAASLNAAEPIELPRSGTPEYAEWRMNGTLPEKTQPTNADPATADPPKEDDPAVDPDPAAGKKQESRRKPDAEARIAELTAKLRERENELAEARKPKEAKADPPPARQPETSTKPNPDDKNTDGSPKYKAYEDYVEALADWKAEERIAKREREQQSAKQQETVKQKITEARERYTDFDSKALPIVQGLHAEGVSREVFAVMDQSPVLADVLYTIGGSEETKADFLEAARSNPGKALRVALLIEQEIVRELGKGSSDTGRNEKGQFTKPEETTPVRRGPESAPKPPIEIGNRGAIPKESDAAETGDFRAFKRAQDAKELKGLRGA